MKLFFLLLQINNVFCFNNYKEHTLYGATATTDEQMQLIHNLTDFVSVNFWRYTNKPNQPVEFTIGPEENSVFLRMAEGVNLNFTMHIHDIQSVFENQSVKTYTRKRMNTFDWDHFFRLRDMYAWFNDLVERHPNKCQIIKLGRTFENRDIVALKVTLKPNPRSVVIMEAGIHGREWLGPAVLTYFLNSILIAEENNDKIMQTIAETYEWYIIPILNPDGYEYSFTRDRMWRKNRRRFHDGKGVDLNSNFGYHFGEIGTSDHAASPRYCGTHALSERETKLLSELVDETSTMLEYYISFHAYGQYLTIPYPDVEDHLDNYDEVKQMCEEFAFAIRQKRGTNYIIGNSYETIGYYSSGSSAAWVKKYHRVPYVVTVNLPDDGKFGFAIPPENIKPSCEETIDGLKSFLVPRTEKFSKLTDEPMSCSARNAFDCYIIFLVMCLVSFAIS